MTVSERLQALLDGKKIRDVDWPVGGYIHLNMGQVADENNIYAIPASINYPGREWEEYDPQS